MSFSKFIKNARERASLTQAKASEDIGVAISTIQNWERGSCKPELLLLPNIGKVYNIDLRDLLLKLAKDLKIMDDNIHCTKTLQYKDLLPDNLDFSKIENLYFSPKEQNMFLTIGVALEYGVNPIEVLINKSDNILEVTQFIDNKLKKCQLVEIKVSEISSNDKYSNNYYTNRGISTHNINLTRQGEYILLLIKTLFKTEPFNIYNLNFKLLLGVLSVYGIISNSFKMVSTIKQIVDAKDNGCYLEEYDYKTRTKKPLRIKELLKSVHIDYYNIENKSVQVVFATDKAKKFIQVYDSCPGL